MAAMDFGAIIRVNRNYIKTRHFAEVSELILGAQDWVKDPYGLMERRGNVPVEGKCELSAYSYLGTKDFFLALHRRFFYIIKEGAVIAEFGLDNETSIPYEKQSETIQYGDVEITVKRFIPGTERYYVRFVIGGIPYEGIFGYGVYKNIKHWYGLTPKEKRKVKLFMSE